MQRIDLLILNVRQRAANHCICICICIPILQCTCGTLMCIIKYRPKLTLLYCIKLYPSVLNNNPKSYTRHIDIVAALVTLSGGYPLLMSGQRTLGYNAGQIGGKISDRIFSAWLRCLGLQTVESPRQWRPQTTLNLWPDSGEDINTELSRISKLQQLFSDF